VSHPDPSYRAAATGHRLSIALLREPRAFLPVSLRVLRRPSGQAVHMAVAHAESSRDQHRVVDLKVRGALQPCAFDVLRQNVLAAALYFTGDCQQSFQLVRNTRTLGVLFDIQNQLFIAAQVIICHRAMDGLTEKAIVPRETKVAINSRSPGESVLEPRSKTTASSFFRCSQAASVTAAQ
jgi:hypothetical protein